MKLRILGDTVRLRLAQNEVARLRDAGQVDQTIHFGGGDDAAIRYVVAADQTGAAITARLEGRSIVVRIPAGQVRAWADGDEVSLRASQPIGAHGDLAILVEKDFKCLVPRDGEQDSDGFDNPNEGAGHSVRSRLRAVSSRRAKPAADDPVGRRGWS